MKKISILLLITLMFSSFNISVSADSVFDGGDGTIDNPYIITTADQLNEVRYNLDKHFIQMKDIDLTTATSKNGDYYDNGNGWLPIGDSSDSFTGSYDGNGHSITGMKINRTLTSTSVYTTYLYIGLFSSVSGCVKNLNIEDCNITAKLNCTSGWIYCGGLAGIIKDDSQIINCTVTGDITTSSTCYSEVGGIIGSTQGGTTEKIKIIKDCSTDLAISVSTTSDNYSGVSVGGLIGVGDIMEILNCNSSGTINTYSCGSNYVGGILGEINYDALLMDWCSNNTQISVYCEPDFHNSASHYVGGLIGIANLYSSSPTGNSIVIKNSFNSGDVSSEVKCIASYNRLGGLIGYTSNSSYPYKYDCSITNCYNVGNIITESNAYNDIMGGIVGESRGFTIKNCYNSSPLSVENSRSAPKVGAISGYSTGDTLNLYWNISASQTINRTSLTEAQKVGLGTSSGEDTATAMSPAQLKAKSFVENLNSYIPGQAYWKEDSDNINNGYPILFKSQEENPDEQINLQATANVVNNHIVIFVKPSKEVTDEMLHIALYSGDGRMIDYLIVPTIEAFDKTNVVFKDDVNIAKAKAFLWKSTTSITPLTNAIEINITR